MIEVSKYNLSNFDKLKTIKRFSMRWGGAAGDGLQSTGNLIQKFLNRLGYYVKGFPGTQSTIRGGHVWQHVEFSVDEIFGFTRKLDLLIALQPVTLDVHLMDLKQDSILIINSDKVKLVEFENILSEKHIYVIEIPMTSLARDIEIRTSILANTIAVGVVIALLNLDEKEYELTLRKRFKDKPSIQTMNIQALKSGIDYYNENYDLKLSCEEGILQKNRRLVISGNEIIAIGATAAGLKFLAQYPITPASSILTYLSNRAKKYGIVVRQAEDELAAIMMIIGASYAGARSMTASSGPGLSLMSESLGYAAMTETPIVIVDAMRAGPSTGIPTKMEQADLYSMIYMSHGESPRAIFAPRSIEEAFSVTVRAFNIAEKYQLPVFILSDFSLSEGTKNVEPFNLDVKIERGKIWKEPTDESPVFKRHQLTEDGVSPRAFPPTLNATYIAVGAEHDEDSHSLSGNRCGLPNSWVLREKMFDKRFKKLEALRKEMTVPQFYGEENADYTIISWGSTQGAIKEAIKILNGKTHYSWNMLSFVDLYPLPFESIKKLLNQINKSIMYEVNYTGQFENLIHHHLDWRATYRIRPLTGETPTYDKIINELKDLLNIELEA